MHAELINGAGGGEVLGPLAGIPVVVKDTMDMVGFPTTAGWRLLYSKTGGIAACIGQRPANGYAANLTGGALKGARIGTPNLPVYGRHQRIDAPRSRLRPASSSATIAPCRPK